MTTDNSASPTRHDTPHVHADFVMAPWLVSYKSLVRAKADFDLQPHFITLSSPELAGPCPFMNLVSLISRCS